MRAYLPFTWPISRTDLAEDNRRSDLFAARGSRKIPRSPRNLMATSGKAKVTVTWDPPAISTGITGWRVYVDTESNLVQRISEFATRSADVVIGDLDTHNIFVSAVTAAGVESRMALVTAAASGIDSGDLAPNIPTNATNDATVTSLDGGTDATVLIYGPGGAGTNYTKYGGQGSPTRPSASITGQPYGTHVFVVRVANPSNPLYGNFLVKSTYKECQDDDFEFVGDTVTVGGSGGTTPTATAVLSGDVVVSVSVTNGGSGYTSPPDVVFNGGGGTGASGYAVLSGDAVSSVVVSNGGTGYTSAPTVSFSGGTQGVAGGGGDTGGIGGRYPIV